MASNIKNKPDLFNSLNSGLLNLYLNFNKDSLQQYVNYLEFYNGNINELFIIDYLSRKNEWFFKDGVNIIVFEYNNDTEKAFLKCYNSIEPFTYYNPERDTIFLYYNHHHCLYEPLIKITKEVK